MKNILNTTWSGAAAAVLITSIGLTQNANAVVLSYEEAGPGINVGDLFTGPIEIKLQNFDMGVLYTTPLAVPAQGYWGYSGSPGPGVAAGIAGGAPVPLGADVNSALQTPLTVPAFPTPGTVVPTSREDMWGILRVESILDRNTGLKVWTSSVKGTEITGIFYGGQDFFLAPDATRPLTDVVINSAGVKLELWEEALVGGLLWNPFQGPGARGPQNGYPSVTEGVNFLNLLSTPGFIQTNGTNGGSAAEYEAIFNTGALTGLGTAFANVLPGAAGGTQGAFFDRNGIETPASIANGVPKADISLKFTSAPSNVGPVGDKWLIRSQDPLLGDFIPEPGNVLAGLGCMLPMFGVFFGRRRQRQTAA